MLIEYIKDILKKIFKKKQYFLLACFIALIGSFGNTLHCVFIKHFANELNINLYQLININCLVEIIILTPFCFKHLIKFDKTVKNILIIILLSLLYSSDILLYNTGLKSVSVNTGTLIMLLVPLWMCLFNKIILKEKSFHFVNILSLLICILAVLFTIKNEINFYGFNSGFILIFANSIILPIGVIMQKRFNDTRPIVFALWSNAIALFFLSFILSNFSITAYKNFSLKTLEYGILIAVADIMECGGVYLSCKFANVALLQPIRFTRIIFAVIMSKVFLNENVSKYQIIAVFVILFANIVSIIFSDKNKNSKNLD